jgi:MYXO-CTERM domain-containing protein
VLSPADGCDGQGACVDFEGEPCAPYALCADDTACATSCDTDDDCVEGTVCADDACRTNGAPTAEAGSDQVTPANVDVVTLDGSGSTDPDGDTLTYLWTQVDGPAVDLDDPTSDTCSFVVFDLAPSTALTFRLVVSDPWVDSAPDDTVVTILADTANQPPVADAGPDLTVLGNHEVRLDGTGSSDPDGDTLTFQWSIESGPGGAFDDNTSATPTFLAAAVQHEEAVILKLVVNDGQVNSEPDRVTLTVKPLTDLPDTVDTTGEDETVGDVPADGDATADDPDRPVGGGGSGCEVSETPARGGAWLALLALGAILGGTRRRRLV